MKRTDCKSVGSMLNSTLETMTLITTRKSTFIISAILGLTLSISCSSNSEEQKETSNISELNSTEENPIPSSKTKTFSINDSIIITTPENWEKVETEEQVFVIKATCDTVFCDNLVVTFMEDVTSYTKRQIAENVFNIYSNTYENFKLINSQIQKPDSTEMSFDYLLSSKGINLGGTTYLFLRGKKGVIFTFMGFNGQTGEYVETRKIVQQIIESVEFKN